MEGHTEFFAVEHTHNLLPEVNDRGAAHRGLVKAWGTDEHPRETFLQCGSRLRGYFQGKMSKPVAANGFRLLIGRLGNVKTDINHRLERFSLATPRIARNTSSKVRRASFFGSSQQDGPCARAQNGTFGVGVHPFKQSAQEGFVATGDAHGGGLATGQNQCMKRLVNMIGSTALNDFEVKSEFFGRPAQGFSMLVTSTLKHGQTHTEHGSGSMPFPISPTLGAGLERGGSSMHFKNRHHHHISWPTAAIASLSPALFA